MAYHQKLPIWVAANRLLVLLEQAVRAFPRYHKYAVGTDLRKQGMLVCRLIIRVNAAGRENRDRQFEQLVLAIEDLKVLIQLAKEIKAFANFNQFQEAAELAVILGKQSGGWRKSSTARNSTSL